MKIRTRIILSFVLLVGVGFYFLVDWIIKDLRPHYLEAVEETLVDQAELLAALLETEIQHSQIHFEKFKEAFPKVYQRTLSAQIYKLHKTQVDLRVYVTDARGIVLFNSENSKEEGQDYSQWRDVYLTLRGEYGARTSHPEMPEPRSSILYVAAPIRVDGKIMGVVSVGKPTANINFFFQTAQPTIKIAGGIAALSVILLAIFFSTWITHPINQLKKHARRIRDGKKSSLPQLGRSEIAELGQVFEEMRETLEGKKYVENYIQTLTHELKTPIAAIQGAAELLDEKMPETERTRFLTNIRQETKRMQNIIDRLLALAALESRDELEKIEVIEIHVLIKKMIESVHPVLVSKKLYTLIREVFEASVS